MIVKNEREVIARSLETAKPLIDYWVIFDTGSTDGTQEIIKECLKNIPGELHESKWVNFAHNRNEALAVARQKGDYVFWMDADELLFYSPDFKLPFLDKDYYFIKMRQLEAADVQRLCLLSSRLDWKWEGVLHEVLNCPEAKRGGFLNGVINVCNDESMVGARSKIPSKEKYLQDAELLEEGLRQEPNNTRYAYYLAQSYLVGEKLELARKNFERRISMQGGDEQESYLAMYYLAVTLEKMGDLSEALKTYLKAHAFRPKRAEPLFRAALIYRQEDNLLFSYLLLKYALTLPKPMTEVCWDYLVYDYRISLEFAYCALLLGKYEEAFQAYSELLEKTNLPPEIRQIVVKNHEFARMRVGR